MSVEELDTHPGTGRLERGDERSRGDAVQAYDLDAPAGPADEPPPLRQRLRSGRDWVGGHRRALARGAALVAVGVVIGAGVSGEWMQARERAAQEDVVDLEFGGADEAYGVPDSSGADGRTATLRVRNEGALPVEVVGARAPEAEGVRITGVDEGTATIGAGESGRVRLTAEVDCAALRWQDELVLVLEVASRNGRVRDVPLDAAPDGSLGPWSFGWCLDQQQDGRPVDVSYEGPAQSADPGVFALTLSLTSRDDDVLVLRGVEPPFPSVTPLSGLQEVTILPPGREVEAAVRFDLPSCEESEQMGVSDGLALYVVAEDEELALTSGPSVYASGGTRFQRDLLDAIDRQCPRRG